MHVKFLSALVLGSFVPVLAYDRAQCQAPTQDPLQGCPEGTVLVGPNAAFTSIQAAILSIPHDTTPYTILILSGNYTEQVNITRPGPLTLLGETTDPNTATHNTVNLIWHNATGTSTTGTYDNAYTSTLTIAPTLNSSLTGSGPTGNTVPSNTPFGNQDFRAYNLNIINAYLPYSAGPSLAISVSYANTSFYHTRLASYQDTVYIGKLGNAYMRACEISGETDFLYGFGSLYITSSTLLLRSCGGGITAWKGTNTSYENAYGAYVYDSVVRAANASVAETIKGRCALGRPWNALDRSVFAHNYLDASILPAGYVEWSSEDPRVDENTTMAEFRDYGPGFNLSARLAARNVTIEFTREEYERYSTPERVFQFPFSSRFGNTAWIDRDPYTR